MLHISHDDFKLEPYIVDPTIEEEDYILEDIIIDEYVDDEELVGIIWIFDSPPLPHSVPSLVLVTIVRCTFTQPSTDDNILGTFIFYTYIKIDKKMCKTIIDSGSCINVVLDTLISHLKFLLINHPQPYHVPSIDSTFILIKNPCLLPLKVQSYDDM